MGHSVAQDLGLFAEQSGRGPLGIPRGWSPAAPRVGLSGPWQAGLRGAAARARWLLINQAWPLRAPAGQGRAGHPALPPRCFILTTDCTNPRTNIELAWILNSSVNTPASRPWPSAPCLRRAFRCRWPQALAGQAAQGAGRTESVPQEPDSESSDLPLRREDVPLGWKGLEGPCREARR